MASMARAAGVDFYKWGMVLEMKDGTQQRMRAVHLAPAPPPPHLTHVHTSHAETAC